MPPDSGHFAGYFKATYLMDKLLIISFVYDIPKQETNSCIKYSDSMVLTETC